MKPGKTNAPKSSISTSRSSDGRGAASTGTKRASNAKAARRQGEKSEANKASDKKGE